MDGVLIIVRPKAVFVGGGGGWLAKTIRKTKLLSIFIFPEHKCVCCAYAILFMFRAKDRLGYREIMKHLFLYFSGAYNKI